MPGKASTIRKIIESVWTRTLGAAVVLALLALCARLVMAQQRGDVELIADVRVTGNVNIPTEQILRYVHIRAGMDFNRSRVYDDTKRLLDSKMFKDVRPEMRHESNGWVVTYHIFEYPNTVLEVVYNNAHHISQKDLEGMMPDVRKGLPLNPHSNKKACRDIEDYLKNEKGRYWATVKLEEGAKPTDRRVVFNISEGPVLRVRSTQFVGGSALASAARLRTQINTSREFPGLKLGGKYNEKMVDGDVKKLEDYFVANGYRMAKVHRELKFSDDYSEVDIIFHIHEGMRYKVESVTISNNPVFSEAELRSATQLKPGVFFNEGSVKQDEKNLEAYLGWRGFKPKIQTEVWDSAPGLVNVNYEVTQAEPAKVGKIYVIGNDVTQDRVILRLLGLYPGQTLRYPEVKLGEAALMRSNLFEMKSEDTKPSIEVLESKDGFGVYKDILVRVKETQTGSFMIGAGINSNAGLMGNIVLNERNFDLFRVPTSLADFWDGRAFRGAGQEFRIEAVPGTVVQRYAVTLREPFLFDLPYSLTNSGYFFERFYTEDTEERLGYRVTLAHTFNNTWPDFITRLFDSPMLSYFREARYALSANAGLRLEDVTISGLAPFAPIDYTSAHGHNLVIGPRVGATFDTRDSFLRPTTGGIVDTSVETDFGAFTYQMANLTASRYFTTWQRPDGSGKHVLALRSQVGWASSSTPVFDRYYAGGYGTVRGFQFRGVGPNVSNFEVGGDFMFLNSIEYQIPVQANDQLYFVTFLDSGTVESSVEIRNYRVSAGVGLRLALPMLGPLPLALDFGVPIVFARSDHREFLAFSVGFFH